MTSQNKLTEKPQPSTAVIEQIAESKGVESVELTPLYRAVDPDALDALFDDRPGGHVKFMYEGLWVTASFIDGELSVKIESQDGSKPRGGHVQ